MMSVSVKKATGKTNINHNNRKFKEWEKEKNSHIDYERSKENKYLVQKDIRDVYKEEFGDALEKYNNKQTRNDRKIKDYYKHIEASKKTATQQEMIIQVGDREDFSKRKNRELANEVLEDWFSDFKKNNPNLKIYNAAIHNDEASPHLHVNFVPVAEGYKRGLERQVSFDRSIKQQDHTLDQTRPFDDWREKEVESLETKLKERSIERKFVGTNEYKDVNDYKQQQDKLRDINKQIEQKQQVLERLSKSVPEKEEIPYLKREKNWFVETENYVLTPEQFNQVSERVHESDALTQDYHRMQTGELKDGYLKARDRVADLQEENKSLEKRNDKLTKEKLKLDMDKSILQDKVGVLKSEIHQIYHSTRKFLQENTKDRESFKSVFGELFKKIRDNMPKKSKNVDNAIEKSEFEKAHDKENQPSRKQEMEMER